MRNVNSIVVSAIAATLLAIGTCPNKTQADFVVGHDINTLASNIAGIQEQTFAVNVANFLTADSTTKNLLLFESNPGDGSRNYSVGVLNALAGEGFSVTVTGDYSTPFSDFDAIFVAQDFPVVGFLNNSDLINYVNDGGGVYVVGGVGPNPNTESAGWNAFLNNYGLAFATSYNGINNVPITSSHPIFDGITALNSGIGQSIIDQGTNPNALIVQSVSDQAVYAVVTVSLPPILLGDINGDGVVNLLDVTPFVALITSGDFQAEADINGDGVVSLLDVEPFVELLTGN